MGKGCSSIFFIGWGCLLLGLTIGCAGSWVGWGGLSDCYTCCEDELELWGKGKGWCVGGDNGIEVCW